MVEELCHSGGGREGCRRYKRGFRVWWYEVHRFCMLQENTMDVSSLFYGGQGKSGQNDAFKKTNRQVLVLERRVLICYFSLVMFFLHDEFFII